MGLTVSVYRQAETEYSRRWPNDATNGGISSRYPRLCVMNVSGPFEPDDETAPVVLVKGQGNTVILVPAEKDAFGVWTALPRDTKAHCAPCSEATTPPPLTAAGVTLCVPWVARATRPSPSMTVSRPGLTTRP